MDKTRLSIVVPTFNESANIKNLIVELIKLEKYYSIEIIVVDDNSEDNTAEIVKNISKIKPQVRILSRLGRSGLASAIKEGLINSTGEIAVVMDADGQHEPSSIVEGVNLLNSEKLDLVLGSRFHKKSSIRGLSNKREKGSTWANQCARKSLSKKYKFLTDYMTGFFILKINKTIDLVKILNINGFKFLYELLSLSKGKLRVSEFPLTFQERKGGDSKLDLAVFWDFLISLIHTLTLRIFPRRAISFGMVGFSGIIVQLIINKIITSNTNMIFEMALAISVVCAATSNYLINNILTFRSSRLKGRRLVFGLVKFLIVSILPVIANVGIASAFYNLISRNSFLAQLAGIVLVYVWNYIASSRFVWNNPN